MIVRNLLLDPTQNPASDPTVAMAAARILVECPCGARQPLATFEESLLDAPPIPPANLVAQIPMGAADMEFLTTLQTREHKCHACGLQSRFLDCQPVYYIGRKFTMEELSEILRNAPKPAPESPKEPWEGENGG